MIGTIYGEINKPVTIKGVTGDYGNKVVAVEFSLDAGLHWTRYETGVTDSVANVYWSFDYVPPKAGSYHMLIRSVNEHGQVSPEPAFVDLVVR
ncbi:MAG: hypothetical protein HFJ72_07020 [Adlercreutzia sp.]|nr:hypothetical protein [Adlercreutzia sp.]